MSYSLGPWQRQQYNFKARIAETNLESLTRVKENKGSKQTHCMMTDYMMYDDGY